MDALLQVLFTLAATPTAIAAFVLIRYSARPVTFGDDVDGYARIAIFAGAVLGIACAINGWVPRWHEVMFVAGIGTLTMRRASHIHRIAVENHARKLADEDTEHA
jgi:hypothetical protein